VTDDLRARLADALPRGWLSDDDRRRIAAALLPVVEAHGRASAATALRQAADDIQMDPPDYVPDVLRDRADALEAHP
jgi:hypothetical protein